MKQQVSSTPGMLSSQLLKRQINNNEEYLCGYTTVVKTKCEIPLYVSPTFRILRFSEGVADWLVDGKIHRFQAGDYVIFSNICKRNIDQVLTDRIVFEMFDFYPSVLLSSQLWQPYFSDHPLIFRSSDDHSDRISHLFDQLKEEILGSALLPFSKESIVYLINMLSIMFLRESKTSNTTVYGQSVYCISQSTQYMLEHISEKLTLEKLASLSGYSSEYYSRLFKRYTGLSPMQYLINLRIDKALQLIHEKNMTVLDAAFSCGFQSSSAFYKTFKKYRGISPMVYLVSSKDDLQSI